MRSSSTRLQADKLKMHYICNTSLFLAKTHENSHPTRRARQPRNARLD